MKSYNFTKQSVSHISQTVKTVEQLTTDLTRPKKPRPIMKQEYNGSWKVQKVNGFELKVTDLFWSTGQGLNAGVETNLFVSPGSGVVYANFSPEINNPYASVIVDYAGIVPISGSFYIILASIVADSYEISTIKQIQYGPILINSVII